MKNLFILSLAIVLSLTAMTFKPSFVNKENLITNYLTYKMNKSIAINADKNICIPPSISVVSQSSLEEHMPEAQLVYQVCPTNENINLNIYSKNILKEIDMRSLDK